jgi:hypothetical protein
MKTRGIFPFLLWVLVACPSVSAGILQDVLPKDFSSLKLPPSIEKLVQDNTQEIICLFGVVCVGGCPIGEYIHRVKDNARILYVVPPEFSAEDLANFHKFMAVKGRIYQASEEESGFFRDLAKALQLENWENNFVIKLDNRKIQNVKTY